MTDIMNLALAKRERLMSDLEQLNEFIRMAEKLVREEKPAKEQAAPRTLEMQEPVAQEAGHRSLSSVLRDADDREPEPVADTSRRTGLWRAAPSVAARG